MSGRGFSYELDAARVRAAHRLEHATRAAGAARQRLQQDTDARLRLLVEMEALGRSARPSASRALDPQQAMARTSHLLRLRRRIAALDRTLEARRRELDGALAELTLRHAECEAFERHRQQCLQQYQRALAARAAIAADHDWLSRTAGGRP